MGCNLDKEKLICGTLPFSELRIKFSISLYLSKCDDILMDSSICLIATKILIFSRGGFFVLSAVQRDDSSALRWFREDLWGHTEVTTDHWAASHPCLFFQTEAGVHFMVVFHRFTQ